MKRISAPCCAVFAFSATAMACPGSLARVSSKVSSWLLPVRVLSHTLNCRDDVLIRATSANDAAHEFLHLGVFRSNRLRQQRHSRHDLAACAVATLICVVNDERFLDRMQVSRLSNTFNRRDL